MRRPLIGISAYGHIHTTRWDFPAVGVPRPYVEAVLRAGGEPVLIPPGANAETILARLDGLILAGGGDIDPAAYGAEPHPTVERVDSQRDATELALARTALGDDVPLLAICRGHQIVNVALGGTLHQHLGDQPGLVEHIADAGRGFVAHDVRIEGDSLIGRVVGRSRLLATAAQHHQAVDELGKGLVAVGWSDDGIVEAIELPGSWLLSVEWHPEMTAENDPAQQALFDALVAQSSSSRDHVASG